MSLRAPLPVRLDEAVVWRLLRGIVAHIARGDSIRARTGLVVGSDGAVHQVAPERGAIWVDPRSEPSFGCFGYPTLRATELLELYLPLCVGPRADALVIGHLGQSLDGQIATASGASRYVTGQENLEHIHRLRALCDAVVVGAETVVKDDPQLTTRLVPGQSPVRVIVDPGLRVPLASRVFARSGPRTVVVCAAGRARPLPRHAPEIVEVEDSAGRLEPARIVEALGRIGLGRLFVEGGGVTVSRFLEARALDRLHLTVSPVIIGAGRSGLRLPPIDRLESALRPRTRRFDLGPDVLFDCELDTLPAAGPK